MNRRRTCNPDRLRRPWDCGHLSAARLLLSSLLAFTVCGCGNERTRSPAGEVVIYTALDQIYSEPILRDFERQSGVRVKAVYDTEAAKTTGLVSRLLAERDRPRCDVFWNNEIVHTLRLKNEGILEPFSVPNLAGIPPAFKDAEGYWAGFAARARVIVFNTKLVAQHDVPRSIEALTGAHWRGRIGMAYPLFGTTAAHAAILFAEWGESRASALFEGLAANDLRIFEGNMSVCRAVAQGEIPLGLTDTDDAHLLRSQGKPVDWVLIDHGGEGALLIPNSLALIRGAVHPDAARRLIDYLLSPEVEARLAASPSAQIPLHPGVSTPPVVQEMAGERFWEVDYARAAERMEPAADILKILFARP